MARFAGHARVGDIHHERGHLMMTEALITLSENSHRWGSLSDGPVFWPIFPIAWFLLIAGGITTAILLARRSGRAAPRREAETRLATRFATGEISVDEYRERLVVLRQKG